GTRDFNAAMLSLSRSHEDDKCEEAGDTIVPAIFQLAKSRQVGNLPAQIQNVLAAPPPYPSGKSGTARTKAVSECSWERLDSASGSGGGASERMVLLPGAIRRVPHPITGEGKIPIVASPAQEHVSGPVIGDCGAGARRA